MYISLSLSTPPPLKKGTILPSVQPPGFFTTHASPFLNVLVPKILLVFGNKKK